MERSVSPIRKPFGYNAGMTTMIAEVYDALVDAGASPEKATAAATAIADVDKNFVIINQSLADMYGELKALNGRMDGLEGRLNILLWVVGGIGFLILIEVLKPLYS